MHTVFRPWFSRALTILIGVICATGLVITVIHDGWAAAWTFGPWLALLAGAVWAMYWHPFVEVREDGVRVVNIVRAIDIPWHCLTEVEVVWSLTFTTSAGRFAAWAAPAPSAIKSIREARRQPGLLRRRSDRTVADPDPERSGLHSLQALTREIQRAWDGARSEGSSATATVSVNWHGYIMLVGGALLALTVLSAVTA
ncbi:MAG: hypothetical protein ABI382_04640 [Nakamurella sp.]